MFPSSLGCSLCLSGLCLASSVLTSRIAEMQQSSTEIIVTCSLDGPLIAFDLSSGRPLLRFIDSPSPRKGLAFVGNDLIAVAHTSAGTGSGLINLHNWRSSTPVNQILMPVPVAPLAATSDGLHLFSGDISGRINTIFLPSGDLKRSATIHQKPVSCLEIIKEGSLLISGGDDGVLAVIPVWTLVSEESGGDLVPQVWQRLVGHAAPVTAITSGIGGGNCTVISSSLDMTCKFWNLLHGKALKTVAFPCVIYTVAMDSYESHFYAAGSDGAVYKGAMKAAGRTLRGRGQKVKPLSQKHNGPVTGIEMIRGKFLVSASEDGSIWIWDVEAEQVIMVLGQDTGSITSMIAGKLDNNGGCDRGKRKVDKGGFCGCDMSLSGSLTAKAVAETIELENMLKEAENERKRSVDTLEAAVTMYEKMLELILKEAKCHCQAIEGNRDREDDNKGY